MIALLLSAALLLSGCGLFSNGVVTLFTNRPEIAAYAEAFNAAQDNHRLEIKYRDNPSEAMEREEAAPDLVIAECLSGKASISRFRSLNKLFDKNRLNRESFYTNLLAMGQKDKQQLLVPLSFNLPVLMFDTRVPGEETSTFFLNLDKIQEISALYNRREDERYTAMGFSPRWNPDFLVLTAFLLGSDFTDGADSMLSWNDRNLRQSVDYLRKWSKEKNGGTAAEVHYAEKYLYDPPYRQVTLGRAKFAYTTAADFFSLPENRRISLDIRWIAHRDKIPALECILFAGIPMRGKNPRGAEAFLQWLLDPEIQKKLLDSSRRKMVHTFGIAAGFSSLRDVNEREFPRFYPHLAGHIPPADILVFPPSLAANWPAIKEQVVKPWLVRQIAGEDKNEDLGLSLRNWLMKQTF